MPAELANPLLWVIATFFCFVWLEGEERRLFHAVADVPPDAMQSGASFISSYRANTNDINSYLYDVVLLWDYKPWHHFHA
jgi:hypothetical protein